jgi:hypothetical protein
MTSRLQIIIITIVNDLLLKVLILLAITSTFRTVAVFAIVDLKLGIIAICLYIMSQIPISSFSLAVAITLKPNCRHKVKLSYNVIRGTGENNVAINEYHINQ